MLGVVLSNVHHLSHWTQPLLFFLVVWLCVHFARKMTHQKNKHFLSYKLEKNIFFCIVLFDYFIFFN